MKKLSIFIIAFMFFPAMLFAQTFNVTVPSKTPTDLTVNVAGYNERIPAAVMNLKFEFDEVTETLLIRMGSNTTMNAYNKVWLPQHPFGYTEMANYMKTRGVKMKKAQTYVDQENFLGLGSKAISASIQAKGMKFTGMYDLKSPKKVKKQLDYQMVPLDGVMELDLLFNVEPKAKQAQLTLLNPIPMTRKGSKGTLAFVAEDIVININLERSYCKDNALSMTTIEEYLAIFNKAEERLLELQKKRSAMLEYLKNFVVSEIDEIDFNRFKDTGCDDLQDTYEELAETIERIKQIGPTPPPPTNCDTKKLNEEVKSTTKKLNNMVNDWSLAGDAATKAEKKAAFEAEVKRFDNKLNGLPSGCKEKLDKKLLKDYEFVKKLVK